MQIADPNEYRYWKTMRAIGFALLIFLLLINLFGGFITFLEWILAFAEVPAPASIVIHHLLYSAGYLIVFMVPVAFLRLFIRKSGFPYQSMRAAPKLSPWLPLILLAGTAAIWTLAYLNAAMVSIFRYSEFSAQAIWGTGKKQEWYELILQFIMICMVPAFCEEFLFRGAILTNCLPFGRGTAVFISAILFGLMHQNAEQIFYAFGAGLVLGLVYERTGSIWNCVLLHMINNFLSTFEGVFLQGFSERTAETAGAVFEVSIAVLGIVSAIILIVRFAPRKETFRNGFFGKDVPTDDAYTPCPVGAKQAVKRFFSVPMILFFVLATVQIVLLLGMAVFSRG